MPSPPFERDRVRALPVILGCANETTDRYPSSSYGKSIAAENPAPCAAATCARPDGRGPNSTPNVRSCQCSTSESVRHALYVEVTSAEARALLKRITDDEPDLSSQRVLELSHEKDSYGWRSQMMRLSKEQDR